MKPIKTFLFFFIILIVLFIISLVFPEEGITITGSVKINFPGLKDLNRFKSEPYKDIQNLVAEELNDAENPSDFFSHLYHLKIPVKQIHYDTISLIKYEKEIIAQKPQQSSTKTDIKVSQPIECKGSIKNALGSFYKSLKNLKNSNELIRVLHYGDSQIEGDRITSYLRNELQKKFGGSGIGMFPVVLLSEHMLSVKHNISKNWERYTIHDITGSNINHKRFGIMLSYSRFTPIELLNDNKLHEAWINIEKSDISYNLAREFTRCRLFYGYNRKPLIIEIFKNDKLFDAEILLPNKQLQVDEWVFDEPGTELSIRFKGEDSPDIYAVALDNSNGVAVDNIPLRGSKGLDFTKTDLEFLKEIYEKLNVKLIILQFGANLVPLMADDYTFYEEQLYEQLTEIKKIQPDLSIIVVGISDMSRNNGGVYETYPQILKIRKAQKNAAFKAGCAFWDMFQAMGGQNSMPSWVYNNPPLANKDFTHFTYTGSKVIAKKLYKAIISEYENYLNAL